MRKKIEASKIFDGPTTCKRNSKMIALFVDKKYRNLKLNITDSNNSNNGPKKYKNNEIKYKTIN